MGTARDVALCGRVLGLVVDGLGVGARLRLHLDGLGLVRPAVAYLDLRFVASHRVALLLVATVLVGVRWVDFGGHNI